VLPDHLHAFWTLPEHDMNFSASWQAIKTAFSKQIPPGEFRSASRESKGERGLWQRRFWEHTIRDDKDYATHVDYVHFNPVKHECSVADWPYSSFRKALSAGIYPENWAGGGLELNNMKEIPSGER
jgi:putative transposase